MKGNHCHFSGWIWGDPTECRSAANGRPVLMFMLKVPGCDADEHALKMRVEDQELLAEYSRWLTRSRGVSVHAMARNVPVIRNGVTIAETTAFVVDEITMHDRSGPRAAEKASDSPTENPGVAA